MDEHDLFMWLDDHDEPGRQETGGHPSVPASALDAAFIPSTDSHDIGTEIHNTAQEHSEILQEHSEQIAELSAQLEALGGLGLHSAPAASPEQSAGQSAEAWLAASKKMRKGCSLVASR